LPERLTLTDIGDWYRILAPRFYAHEQGSRGGPAHAVGGEPGIALKLEHRSLRVFAEDAVDAAGVEAEGAQPALEVGHVVTTQRGRGVVQEPVAEVVAGLDQGTPRLRAADAVDAETPALLEGTDGALGRRPVDAGPVRAALVAGRPEPRLEVPDRLARRSPPEQGIDAAGYRNSASSWTSWPLPLAPIMRFLATPSWNSTSVGMLMIS
jgi:hypothetical protein